jgi:pimeloyl-ACP methyl ester carboxylesterase
MTSLQNMRQTEISAFVLLAPPPDCKAVIPGLSLLRLLPKRTLQSVVAVLHLGAVKSLEATGTPAERMPAASGVQLQYFHTPDAAEFLDYILGMKEPADFIRFLESIIAFRHKDAKISFFEYYYAKYVMAKPKLFIYGRKDILLRPFMPFARGRLEKLYRAFGSDVKIEYLDTSHWINESPWQGPQFEAIKDPAATVALMTFLDKNV